MSVYSRLQVRSPKYSVFDLSHNVKFDCDMGQLIPILCDEMVPGDIFKLGNEIVIRFNPLIAPILHEVVCICNYFFVPYRILWDQWTDFITGGVDGLFEADPPTWIPSVGKNVIGSLWDYMGMPVGVSPAGAYPLDFPRRAYNKVYNDYYRDQTLQDEVDLDNEDILRCAWRKDYFTSALTGQQRGVAPALPVSGIVNTSAVWAGNKNVRSVNTDRYVKVNDSALTLTATGNGSGSNDYLQLRKIDLDANTISVDLSGASTFDVADLRLAVQIQRWLERNNVAGSRYNEFLMAHYGKAPRDETLQRPQWIGGTKSNVIVSEVLQTSSTDATTPQGNLAGHGILVDGNYAGTARAYEHGLVLGLMRVVPKPSYQQGINRQWLRRTKYDFYFPEFAHLSEQAIETAELYASNVQADNLSIFGYQQRFNEMRTKDNRVCGNMRDTLDYWHLGRKFASKPLLNSEFITCNPRKDVFAVNDEPGLICMVGNSIKAIRPMPVYSEPGRMDH